MSDPCAVGNINSGLNPATRKANCIAAVRAAGYASTNAEAETFLSTFSPGTPSVLGARFGNDELKPERGESWTAGVVLEPRYVPNLRMSFDYIDIQLKDQLTRVSAEQLLTYCYDSASYPDNSGQFGLNTCGSVPRYTSGTEPNPSRAFSVNDGWQSTYLNLAQTNLRAANIVVVYRKKLAELFGSSSDWGSVSVNSNLYRVYESSFSPTGLAGDTEQYLGSIVISGKTTDVVDVGYMLKDLASEISTSGSAPPVSGLKVLLVEDSLFFRNLTVPLLKNVGYDVMAAAGPVEALGIIERGHHFDVIVTDIEMPDMDGFELARRLRADIRHRQVPIIAFTSTVSEAFRDRGAKAGIGNMILKTDREALLDAIAAQISQRIKELAYCRVMLWPL
jgi:CheY-like chemotaxis protein